MKNDPELLGGVGPPLPPSELRARVLAAAEIAFAHEATGRWTRIWQSRPLRLSWAAAMAFLALAHLALSLKLARREEPPVSASIRRPGESELDRATSVPRIDPSHDAWTALGDEDQIEPTDRFRRATPSALKEKSS
jgi:hypothetical protein